MNFELTQDQREIQTLTRDFAREWIEPNATEWDREHRFPRELFMQLSELGLLGACIPEEYGGAGADFLSYILVLEELSRADAGVGVTVAVHTSAVTLPILTFGTDEQKSRFVPPLARGDVLGAFALTEPEVGSDAGSLRTRADANGDGWTITGAKQWITNGSHAGTFLLFARTDQETPGARGISAFILDAEHVRVTREEEKLGLNSSVTSDIVVEGAQVGRDRSLEGEQIHDVALDLEVVRVDGVIAGDHPGADRTVVAEECLQREVEKVLGGHAHVLHGPLEVPELLVKMPAWLPQHRATSIEAPDCAIFAPSCAKCSSCEP